MVINLHQRHRNFHGCWTHSTCFCYQLPSKTETHIFVFFFFSIIFLNYFPITISISFTFIIFVRLILQFNANGYLKISIFRFLLTLRPTRCGKARHTRPPQCVNTTLFFRSAFKPEWSMSGYVVRVWLHWHSFITHESRWISIYI